jgi:hypothetical protein
MHSPAHHYCSTSITATKTNTTRVVEETTMRRRMMNQNPHPQQNSQNPLKTAATTAASDFKRTHLLHHYRRHLSSLSLTEATTSNSLSEDEEEGEEAAQAQAVGTIPATRRTWKLHALIDRALSITSLQEDDDDDDDLADGDDMGSGCIDDDDAASYDDRPRCVVLAINPCHHHNKSKTKSHKCRVIQYYYYNGKYPDERTIATLLPNWYESIRTSSCRTMKMKTTWMKMMPVIARTKAMSGEKHWTRMSMMMMMTLIPLTMRLIPLLSTNGG